MISALVLILTVLVDGPFASAADRWEVNHLGDDGEGSLRDAIAKANAAGAGDIVFGELAGTLQVESALPTITGNVRLVGPLNRSISIHGGQRHSLLAFSAGTTGSVSRLTFTEASPSNFRHGGAISNAGSLDLEQCRFIKNTNKSGWGGAIYNEGTLLLRDCEFVGNSSVGRPDDPDRRYVPVYESELGTRMASGNSALGGAIFQRTGTLSMSNCVFNRNSAIGGVGLSMDVAHGRLYPTQGGDADGGAVYAGTGEVRCQETSFDLNFSSGGTGGKCEAFGIGVATGGAGGDAHGGAIHSAMAKLSMDRCKFTGNTNSGGTGGDGPGLAGLLTGGRGGAASGGALFTEISSDVRLEQCSLLGNVSLGGKAGSGRYSNNGGPGSGGGMSLSAKSIEIMGCSVISNRAMGGPGDGGGGFRGSSNSGTSRGGGLEIRYGPFVLGNSTVSLNSAGTPSLVVVASPSADPSDPSSMPRIGPLVSYGGGVVISDSTSGATLQHCSIVSNTAMGASILSWDLLRLLGSAGGSGGGVWVAADGYLNLQSSVIAGNISSTNADVSARLVSTKRNLIQDSRGAENLQPEDLTGLSPLLGALTDAGDDRWVYVPEANSPVIDASTGVPGGNTDQLGNSRVAGKAADLGAVERQASDPSPSSPRFVRLRLIAAEGGMALEFTAEGSPGKTLILEASEDLRRWTEVDRIPSGETRRTPVDRMARAFVLRTAER